MGCGRARAPSVGGSWILETHKATGPEPLSHELKLFLDACANRTEPAVDVEAGLLALRVVEAAQQSSKLGRRVPLSEMI